MALTKSITLKSQYNTDIVFDGCYIMLIHLSGNKHSMLANFGIYAKHEGDLLQEKTIIMVPDLTDGNFIQQAYNRLKATSEFADAVDC